jgi:methylglutaconyl-CoA hydratase
MKEAQDLTQAGHVQVSYNEKVSTIEFQHPSHNSLPSKLLSELAKTLLAEGAKEEVVLIIVKSSGDRTFCAGASFDELVAIEDEAVGKTFFMGFANVINAIRTCGKIVIGRVQGKAVGGGVGLASAFDYCMASKYASIKLSELAVGIGPFVIGPAVQRKIGLSAFSQMAINATEWYTAEWGKSRGLFHEVFATTEQLDAYLLHFVDKLKEMNPEALSGLKKVFWEGTDNWDTLLAERAAKSGQLVLSDFSKKTIRGFLKA